MSVTFRGTSPSEFDEEKRRELKNIINEEISELESNLVEATPADTGRLRQSWTARFASENNLEGVVSQSSKYFLPLELGRKPGKGISKSGQQSVAKWARRKLNIEDGNSFAFLLSQKYKREGRKAEGFAGLAKPGSNPASNTGEDLKPVEGGLIKKAFDRLKRRIN